MNLLEDASKSIVNCKRLKRLSRDYSKSTDPAVNIDGGLSVVLRCLPVGPLWTIAFTIFYLV